METSALQALVDVLSINPFNKIAMNHCLVVSAIALRLSHGLSLSQLPTARDVHLAAKVKRCKEYVATHDFNTQRSKTPTHRNPHLKLLFVSFSELWDWFTQTRIQLLQILLRTSFLSYLHQTGN